MKHKHVLTISLFIILFCTLAAAQTRRIEAKKKPTENSGMDKPEIMFNSMHSAIVTSIAYSPDGKYLASGSSDKTIKLWKVASGKCVKTLSGGTLAYSPDGACLATYHRDHHIEILKVPTGECIKKRGGNSSSVYSVAYSPGGTYLVNASSGEIKLWEAQSGKYIKKSIRRA